MDSQEDLLPASQHVLKSLRALFTSKSIMPFIATKH